MIEPYEATIVPVSRVRALADGDRRYDLFDRLTDYTGPILRPLVIAVSTIDAEVTTLLAPESAILVWGHALLEHRRGDEVVPILIFDGTDGFASCRLLRLALLAEGRAGRYRWSEIDRVQALANGAGRCDLASLIDPDRDVTALLPRYRVLNAVLRDALEAGLVDLRTAERVTALPEETVRTLLGLSEALSFSRRRLLLLTCEELVRGGDDRRELVAELGKCAPEKRLELVMARRYPRLRRMEAMVEHVRRERLRGTGVRLDPPAQFEGERYRISFDVGSVTELHRRVAAAQQLESDLDDLLGILFEDTDDDTLAP